jgi:hypothetical protein
VTSAGIAKSVTARSLKHHRARDNHEWAVRHIHPVDIGNVLEQSIASYTDEPIYPVVSQINEYEAMNIGQNVRAGDLRLIVDGFIQIDETSMLICDGQKCDIYAAPADFYTGNVEMRIIYVRRPKERTDV